jgi:nitrate reductase molybdenum cofactor assembly chaperone
MRPTAAVHDALASLFEYPRADLRVSAEEAARVIAEGCPEALEPLAPFLEHVRGSERSALEELFTRTFDNSSERALEVGWHVFGENYTRGTFMVRMRQRLRDVGVEENGELPDHLSHMLALLGRVEEDDAGDLAHDSVDPAIDKMLDGLQAVDSPWVGVLLAVKQVLQLHVCPERPPVGADVPSEWPPPPPTGHQETCHE